MTQPNREPKSAESAQAMTNEIVWPLHILFDGPPSHESGRFVEVNDDTGKSVRAGEWIEKDGFWELVIQARPETEHVEPEGEVDALVAEDHAILLALARRWIKNRATAGIRAVELIPRLASALSSRRALSREDVAMTISHHVVAYDEGGYGDNRSKDFGPDGEAEAVAYAQSLEARFHPIVWRRQTPTAKPISTQIWPAKADAILSRVAPPSKGEA